MGNRFRIIIDGYNLIFQCGLEGKSRTPIALEKARNRLISTLSSRLEDDLRIRTALVFDALKLPIKETQSVSQHSGITVYYAVEYDDADTMIEELIKQNSAPKKLVVVSSDHRLQKAALRRKSTPVDSDVWFDRLQAKDPSPHQDLPATEQKAQAIEQLKEIDWAAEFGIDENPIEPDLTNQRKSGEAVPDPSRAENLGPVEQVTRPDSDVDEPVYDPFPPGYADDILKEHSDDESD